MRKYLLTLTLMVFLLPSITLAQYQIRIPSAVPSAIPEVEPSKIASISASANSASSIEISWAAGEPGSKPITSYKLYRSVGSGDNFLERATLSGTSLSYIDAGISLDTLYRYRVSSVTSLGESDPSDIASLSINRASNFTISGSVSNQNVTLSWPGASNLNLGTGGFVRFEILRGIASNSMSIAYTCTSASCTTYTFNNLSPGDYYFKARVITQVNGDEITGQETPVLQRTVQAPIPKIGDLYGGGHVVDVNSSFARIIDPTLRRENDSAARSYCSASTTGGFSNWNLSSLDTMRAYFNNRSKISVGVYNSSYRTRSGHPSGTAVVWYKHMVSGAEGAMNKTLNYYYHCERIHYF